MAIFIYKLNNDKTTEIKKSTELQAQVNSLNGTVSNLQEKINTVSETVKQDDTNKTTQNNDIVNKKSISGKFAQNSPDDTSGYWFDAGEYWFKNDGTVENVSTVSYSGIYKINGNIINIHWTEVDDEDIKVSEREDTEILIKDDNTLLLLDYKKEDNNPICWVNGSVFYRQNNN